MQDTRKFLGEVVTIRADRRYCFVRAALGGQHANYFLHFGRIVSGPEPVLGDKVLFYLGIDPNTSRLQAVEAEVLPQVGA